MNNSSMMVLVITRMNKYTKSHLSLHLFTIQCEDVWTGLCTFTITFISSLVYVLFGTPSFQILFILVSLLSF